MNDTTRFSDSKIKNHDALKDAQAIINKTLKTHVEKNLQAKMYNKTIDYKEIIRTADNVKLVNAAVHRVTQICNNLLNNLENQLSKIDLDKLSQPEQKQIDAQKNMVTSTISKFRNNIEKDGQEKIKSLEANNITPPDSTNTSKR